MEGGYILNSASRLNQALELTSGGMGAHGYQRAVPLLGEE